MKKIIASAVAIALLAAPFRVSLAEDKASEYRRIVEAYFEDPNTTASDLRATAINLFTSRILEADSLRFQGAVVRIPPTEKRVRGDHPSCGPTNPTPQSHLGGAMSDMARVLVESSPMWFLLDPTGTLWGSAIVLGVLMGAVGAILSYRSSQDYANCSLACVSVPGSYERAELAPLVKVSYSYDRGTGTERRTIAAGDNGDWFVASDWVTEKTTLGFKKSDHPEVVGGVVIKSGVGEFTTPPPGTEEILCPITLVCTQAKNWSANLTRSIGVTVDADIRQISSGACLDASLVNREKYGYEIVQAIGQDFVGRYYSGLAARAAGK